MNLASSFQVLIPSFLLFSFSLPDVLCDPTGLIWREGAPFEAMAVRPVFTDGLLAEVSRVFISCKVNARRSMDSSRYHLSITLIIS